MLKLLTSLGLPSLLGGPALPWVLLAVLVAFLGSNGFTAYKAYNMGMAHEVAAENARKVLNDQKVAKLEHKAGDMVANAGAHTLADKAKIHETLKPVTRFIYDHVPPTAAQCVLPASLQRVYDASITGDDSYLAADGLGDDGAPSPVSCAEAAATFRDNAEAARGNAAQLIRLQQVYGDLRALYAPDIKPDKLGAEDLRPTLTHIDFEGANDNAVAETG